MGVPDIGPTDGAVDASETGPMIEGPACEMAPAMASSRMVLEGLTGARDFVFDGLGGVAVAQGSTVVLRRAGDTTPVTMVMAGEVVALRFTRSSGLALAVFNNTGAGTGNGAIYQVAPGRRRRRSDSRGSVSRAAWPSTPPTASGSATPP